MVSCCTRWKCSFIWASAWANLRLFTRSDRVKTVKKASEKTMPALVATDFVNKLVTAGAKNPRKTRKNPTGVFTFPVFKVGGNVQPPPPVILKRKNSNRTRFEPHT